MFVKGMAVLSQPEKAVDMEHGAAYLFNVNARKFIKYHESIYLSINSRRSTLAHSTKGLRISNLRKYIRK